MLARQPVIISVRTAPFSANGATKLHLLPGQVSVPACAEATCVWFFFEGGVCLLVCLGILCLVKFWVLALVLFF